MRGSQVVLMASGIARGRVRTHDDDDGVAQDGGHTSIQFNSIQLIKLLLVMLVSGNFFHVVSTLQSIVCHYIFLADQIFYRSSVGSAYRLRSLAVSGFSYFN